MKKQQIFSHALIIVTACALVLSLATTFSWFSSRFVTEPFTFTTAKLASTVTLYKAQDFDLDGYPDMAWGDTDVEPYEIFIPQTDNSVEKVTSEETDTNGENDVVAERKYTSLIINDMRPSEVHTFKITVSNNGTVDSKLIALFSLDAEADIGLLDTLVVTPIIIDPITHKISYGTPYCLDEWETPENDPTLRIAEFLNQDAYSGITNDPDYTEVAIGETKDFYFTIQMLKYSELGTDYDEDVYQSYQGTTFTLSLSVILEAEEFK